MALYRILGSGKSRYLPPTVLKRATTRSPFRMTDGKPSTSIRTNSSLQIQWLMIRMPLFLGFRVDLGARIHRILQPSAKKLGILPLNPMLCKLHIFCNAVSIYGTVGPGHSRYSVWSPHKPSQQFDASRDIFSPQVLLYFGDNFGPGTTP
ncbi:hypothetical protein K438DRAFT_1856987 [Mycena galopus ATCC 62051]|nr:hypothetical protein K438DRAFT_1856987 [Mycena galopus ATCC 62051]